MSEKLLRFLLLGEIKTVRIICKSPMCGAVFEVPLEHLLKQSPAACLACQVPFDVLDDGKSGSAYKGVNWLSMFAEAVIALKNGKLGVEFVLPAKDLCKLDQ